MPAESTPQLEKYELLEEIGHGGMATVYRARDKRLERDVAVKIIHRHLRENQEVAARFVSEARAVAKVKHPNIVEVYDVSEQDDDERYLVVELVGGTTLRKHLQVHGHMPAEVAAALCIEVAAGLEHAHHQGIIHRDVKPENVLVELVPSVSSRRPSQGRASEPGAARVKITDFGIAKLLDVQGVTSTGQVLGSPAHMAPEQIEGGDVSERSDVFGLGVLLYECAVGKLPFEGKNPAQVLRRVLDGTYTPADRARPTVGASWSKIIDKALARDAADRYATAGEFAEALRDQFQVVGFDDPQGELAAYLADPAQYTKGYEDRIVKRLSECARLARKQRATLLAGAHFNRALAFRPNDVQLLAELTGLRRFEMLKRILVRVGAIAAGSLVLGSAAFAITRAIRARDATREALSLAGSAAEAVRGAAPQTEARPEKTALPSEPERKAGRVAGATHRSTPKPTRSVRVTVDPITARVKIDGQEVAWAGKTWDLEVGTTHTFEFSGPNETCCTPDRQEVQVPAGDGDLTVRGKLGFKDATLQLSAPHGYHAICGELGFPIIQAGQALTKRMDKITQSGKCNVISAEGTGLAPKSIVVTLKAGAKITLGDDGSIRKD